MRNSMKKGIIALMCGVVLTTGLNPMPVLAEEKSEELGTATTQVKTEVAEPKNTKEETPETDTTEEPADTKTEKTTTTKKKSNVDIYKDAYGIISIQQIAYDPATTPLDNIGFGTVSNGVAVVKVGVNNGGVIPDVVRMRYSKDRTKAIVSIADTNTDKIRTTVMSAWEFKLHVNKNIKQITYEWSDRQLEGL